MCDMQQSYKLKVIQDKKETKKWNDNINKWKHLIYYTFLATSLENCLLFF